jgi:2-(1,2-epoxy-1,2-dihydrophenyl)acetyl-CoA isomerase
VAYGAINTVGAGGGTGSLAEALGGMAAAHSRGGTTDDHREATGAFIAKRRPTFTGR